jgi:hypothetical protein
MLCSGVLERELGSPRSASNVFYPEKANVAIGINVEHVAVQRPEPASEAPRMILPLRRGVGRYVQPSSFMASPACQILVIWRIFSPSNSMTYT